MRKRLTYQISDTLFIKGILLMLLLVGLHQTLSRQTAFIAQVGLIALAAFFAWALNRIIDEWQWSHPQRVVEFDDNNLYIRQGQKQQTIPLTSINTIEPLPDPAYGSRKKVMLRFTDDTLETQELTLSIAVEDWPGVEELQRKVSEVPGVPEVP